MDPTEAFWNLVLAMLQGRARVRDVQATFEAREERGMHRLEGIRIARSRSIDMSVTFETLDRDTVPHPMRAVYEFLRNTFEPRDSERAQMPRIGPLEDPVQVARIRAMMNQALADEGMISRSEALRQFGLDPETLPRAAPPAVIDDLQRAASALETASETPTVLNTRASSRPVTVTAAEMGQSRWPQRPRTEPTPVPPPEEPKPVNQEPNDAELRFSMMELD